MSADVFVVRMRWADDAVWARYYRTRDRLVADILDGEVPAAEIEGIDWYNREEHASDLVALDEIAEAIACGAQQRQWRGGDGIPAQVRDFIERHAGLAWARGLHVLDQSLTAA